MSRTTDGTWSLQVRQPPGGRVPLRIGVRGADEVRVSVGQGRAAVLTRKELAELIEDLREAGRVMVGLEAAEMIAAEWAPPRPRWGSIADEIGLDDVDGGLDGGAPAVGGGDR